MKITVRITSNFKKEAKHLLKRYKSLNADLAKLEKDLINNPTLGKSLGNNTYKVRLKILSKGKGKSAGARFITYLETEVIARLNSDHSEIVINLISIYDKSELEL